ncbi:MAG: FxDxF family PEP-CTERM protein [Sphingomicrobium sp.]|nr:FxDxF family PEP-CTERM protein [Sphingomonadales bacterium]
MKLFVALAAVSALALAAPATAATTIITPTSQPAGTFFVVGGNIFSGPITAAFGHAGIPAGSFTDLFQFTIPQSGTGSGSITTGTTTFMGVTDLDILSVLVNGFGATATFRDINGVTCTTRGVGTCGADETFAINSVPITFGALNTITVTGTSRGNGSFGGNATFTPGVPEPGTWGMMLLGFGAVGFGMRRTRKTTARAMQAA